MNDPLAAVEHHGVGQLVGIALAHYVSFEQPRVRAAAAKTSDAAVVLAEAVPA